MDRFDQRVAVGLATAGLVCALAAMLGWIVDIPTLRDFGWAAFPLWPWTALGFIALALGCLASLLGRMPVAILCWSVPIGIAAISLTERWLNIDLGFDRLLFPQEIARYAMAQPGQTGLNAIAIFLLLTLSGLSSHLPAWVSGEVRSLIATATAPLIITAVVLILYSGPEGHSENLFTSSLPGGIVSVTIALATVVRHIGLGWVRALVVHPVIRNLRIILLTFVITSALIALGLPQVISEEVTTAPIVFHALIVVMQILALIVVSYWAVTKVTHQHSVQVALRKALDVTTVVLTTLDGRIVHWSNGAAQLYGWKADEVKGQVKYALLRSRCESAESVLPRSLGTNFQELVEIDRQGRAISVLERVYPIEMPSGEQLLALKVIDVSDKVRAIAQLRISEERLAIAMAANRFGAFDMDYETGQLAWSPEVEEAFGLPTGSLSNYDGWAAQVEPEDLRALKRRYKRAIARRQARVTFRYSMINAQGARRIVEGASRNFYHANGTLTRSIGAIVDVTEREEREAALRRREAQLRSIIETAPDAMLVVDEAGVVRVFSAAAEDLWGYTASQIEGGDIGRLVPESHAKYHAALFQQFLKTGTWNTTGGFVSAMGEAADGRRFPLEVRIGVARVDEELLLTLFARDVSERLATEGRLAEMNAELAHVSRQIAVSELATDMAHELNQPLSAATNYLATAGMLINQRGDPARLTMLLQSATEQTLRAGEIIRRLRRFAARGEVGMRDEPLAATLRDAAAMVLVGTRQFDTRLTYAFDPDAPTIFADRIQIQQVLVNLLRNAVDAMGRSGQADRHIHLSSIRLDPRTVAIEIADNGPGIPPEMLGQLFSRFTTTKDVEGGLGVGLSISKRIVEAHGGSLTAENRLEGGALFRFTLVAEQVEEAA